MNYIEAIKYVHAIPKFVRPLGNIKLSGLLDLLGNPHKKLEFIHVAGTNGKGSVCTMTAEILKSAGYKTGLFTSPFIEVFNERIKINGEMIADDVLADYITYVSEMMADNQIEVSEFAFITAVAMKYFADMECDIVVLETGMGGKLDATNIIPVPLCSVITSISLDHTQYLGETIEEIAIEKCGIIKDGGSVVSSPNKNVMPIIKEEADKKNAKLVACSKSLKTKDGFIYKNKEYSLALSGVYQAENGAVVLEIINVLCDKGYKISEDNIVQGFKNVRWPARYEFITPDIVIDGGHNKDGIRALKESLKMEQRPIILVMAMMGDKDYEECIINIADIAECVIATELNMERALKCGTIKDICEKSGIKCIAIPDVKDAIKKAIDLSGGGLICICGSLYLAGEAKLVIKDIIKGAYE